jgi:cytosine deaminase
VRDPWYSLGTADMLDVAFMGLHVAQMSSPEDMRRCFDMVTVDNAAIIEQADFGIYKGALASLIVLDAGDPIEAIRLRPDRLVVISKGNIVSQKRRNDSQLALPDRPSSVRRRHHVGTD